MEYIKVSRKQRHGKKGDNTRKTLLLGVVAGSILAGAGNYEAFAEELKLDDVKAQENGEQLELEEPLTEEELKENAEQLIRDIQEGKTDTYLLLTGALTEEDTLPREFTQRVEDLGGYEEVEEDDTETVKRLKEEQKGLSGLINNKYEDALSLGNVVQGVRSGRIGSQTFSQSVAVSEGESRLNTIIQEINTLLDVKEVVDGDLGDAYGIQGEISQIEEEIRLQLEALLGEDIDANFVLSEDGDLRVTDDYIEYLSTLEAGNQSYSVRSSFINQSTSNSKVLASYYGQSKQLDALIGEGFQYLNQRYVWGGTTLADGGFDCSGLMYRIFKDSMGITLPRVSQDQQNYGKRIPLDQIQPGDLVFWNTPATHVALYLGNGKILEAANPTAGLRVRDVRLSELSSATRVHDFGVSDKDAIVHITNAKRTVSYTPVLSREQSENLNNSNQNRQNDRNDGLSQAEIDAQVRDIEQQARDEQARLDKQKAEEARKQKEQEAKEKEDKQKAEEKQKAEDKKKEEAKQKAEQEAKAKAEAEKKAEEERLAKEKAEAERKAEEQRKAEQEAKEKAEREAQQKAEEEARKAEEARKQQEAEVQKAQEQSLEEDSVSTQSLEEETAVDEE